jgi:hypothetical protein
VTVLQFPSETAVGQVQWEDPREPNGWGHLLAIGPVDVPEGSALPLSVQTVKEVSVLDGGHERVTWRQSMPGPTRLSGLDEFGADGPMPPAEVARVRAMLPHVPVG